MSGFKLKHTLEEHEEWINKLQKKLMPLLKKHDDNGAIKLFNEKSKLGFIDSIYAVHGFRDRMISFGKLEKRPGSKES